jgi:hypothetical protein
MNITNTLLQLILDTQFRANGSMVDPVTLHRNPYLDYNKYFFSVPTDLVANLEMFRQNFQTDAVNSYRAWISTLHKGIYETYTCVVIPITQSDRNTITGFWAACTEGDYIEEFCYSCEYPINYAGREKSGAFKVYNEITVLLEKINGAYPHIKNALLNTTGYDLREDIWEDLSPNPNNQLITYRR